MDSKAARQATVPVLVLGGQENALSVVRSLGRRGIPVRVSARQGCSALRSRFCAGAYPIRPQEEPGKFWERLLLENLEQELGGSIIFPCDDHAVEFLANYKGNLERRYGLDGFVPDLQLVLLDKRKTLELAKLAGCPIPNFWEVQNPADLERLMHEVTYPVIVKPVHSHLFQLKYARKYLFADRPEALISKGTDALSKGLQIVIVECIPGPDDLLSSYYTYIDENGESRFHFTKRVIRRFPLHRGKACYHATEWLPETAELGSRFFREIGFRGFGNIEFKRDTRDGQLKVIESNPRFTAAQELLVRSGLDAAVILYEYLTHANVEFPARYEEDVRLWYPVRDFRSFCSLRARGEISLAGWIKSISRKQVLPYFCAHDLWPAVGRTLDYTRLTWSAASSTFKTYLTAAK